MAKKVLKRRPKKLRNSRGHEVFCQQTQALGKTEIEVAAALAADGLPIVQSTVHRWWARESTPDAARQHRIQEVYPKVKVRLWQEPLPLPEHLRGRGRGLT